jgi:hypothetical protein
MFASEVSLGGSGRELLRLLIQAELRQRSDLFFLPQRERGVLEAQRPPEKTFGGHFKPATTFRKLAKMQTARP